MILLPAQRSASISGRRTTHSLLDACLVLIGRVIGIVARHTFRRYTTQRGARPDVRGAQHYALSRLRSDLPPILHYHALRHTHDDVLPAVERLAVLSGITGHALDLLRTAAVFHDIGYIHTRDDHEGASIAIAREVLPEFGFSADDIAKIAGMIAATKLPQTPHTLSEAILADADLDSLGRVDFFARSDELRAECAACGEVTDQHTWRKQQRRFLESHTYHTPAARFLRDVQKARNIAGLNQYLK